MPIYRVDCPRSIRDVVNVEVLEDQSYCIACSKSNRNRSYPMPDCEIKATKMAIEIDKRVKQNSPDKQ